MANENYVAMTEGVKLFLENVGLEQYFDMFIAKGFDMESDIPNLTGADLDELFVLDANHRNTILKAAAIFKYSHAFLVFEWLREHGLDHYYINFLRADLTDMDDIARLELPNTNLFDELEITMPGHKGRFERAVSELRKRRRMPDDLEIPITQGWWGRPQFLPFAKYDFLCVEASISSVKDPTNSFTIEFMVDSGSDVTTVREEVLAQLNLDLLSVVKSQGVHSYKRKNLYKALLTIGNQNLEIEVIGESYDSLGSRVIRHFRHFINGSKHLWLQGNYDDYSLSPVPLPDNVNVSVESQTPVEETTANLFPECPTPVEETVAYSKDSCKGCVTPATCVAADENLLIENKCKQKTSTFSGNDQNSQADLNQANRTNISVCSTLKISDNSVSNMVFSQEDRTFDCSNDNSATFQETVDTVCEMNDHFIPC